MPRMPETVAALQRGAVVRAARLVRLDFASAPRFLHQGVGPLRTADGTVWSGIGELGQISDIEQAVVPSDGAPSLTLSGVDPGLIAATLAASSEVKGRPARIFDQHYDEGWNLLDAPRAMYVGLMDRMVITDNGTTATIAVSLLTLLYRRRRPAFAYLNHASQSKLYPGDQGARELAALVQRTRPWPNY